jgi:hypothetical protein
VEAALFSRRRSGVLCAAEVIQDQILEITIRHLDGKVLDFDNRVFATRLVDGPKSMATDLEVSYRRVGTTELVRVEQGKPARIVTGPREGRNAVEYEFFLTCTGAYYSAPIEVKVRRVG